MAWGKRRRRKPATKAGEGIGSSVDPPQKPKKPRAPRPVALEEIEKRPYVRTPEEGLPDLAPIVSFQIPGRTITKKTHQEIIYMGGRPRIVPSAKYVEYERHCGPHMRPAWVGAGKEPMQFGVGVRLKIYMKDWSGMPDHTGVMQSVGDILEHHGVIANDKWIHWLMPEDGGHWFEVDKDGSRCEIQLVRWRHPYEGYRSDKADAEESREARKAARAEKASAEPKPPKAPQGSKVVPPVPADAEW